ncbi:hypothetical protein R3W88_004123 [Solanum pinnatisectum]|uniref:Reverse transcriptase zinc-binding domain-containing protein n=1 Tax=Solanum pinnatisectum TaxID=50273 RepID=A0AAV9MR23_9SOLN|nr:hypothetical protein R3W88_004123 [Solanum pinnatisectum]
MRICSGEIDFKWLWKLHCPNKIKHFLWLCQHYRLPTRAYLNSIDVNKQCQICSTTKTIKHIFLECKPAMKLWEELRVLNATYSYTLEFLSLTNQKNEMKKPKNGFVNWKPPLVGYKLNTDGS